MVSETTEVIVDSKKCIGCGKCVDDCPMNAIEVDDEDLVIRVNANKCGFCGQCVDNCKRGVFKFEGSYKW